MIDKQKLHDVIDAMFNEELEKVCFDDSSDVEVAIAIGYIEARRKFAWSLLGAETQEEAARIFKDMGGNKRSLYVDYQLSDLLNQLAAKVWALNHQAPLA